MESVKRLLIRETDHRLLSHRIDTALPGPPTGSEPATDGAELTLFVWRELCENPAPPQIEGPSVVEVMPLLQERMPAESRRIAPAA